jgi:hypothetical protein
VSFSCPHNWPLQQVYAVLIATMMGRGTAKAGPMSGRQGRASLKHRPGPGPGFRAFPNGGAPEMMGPFALFDRSPAILAVGAATGCGALTGAGPNGPGLAQSRPD